MDNSNLSLGFEDFKGSEIAKSFQDEIEKAEGFKPHIMYDPKTGKGYKAEKKQDHERMSKLGYVHEKPSIDEIEKAKKLGPLGPGNWVTIDGRHVYLDGKGNVKAGKVYGKDGDNVKTVSSSGSNSSGGSKEGGSGASGMSDKELNSAIKEAKSANDKASFADGSKNKTVADLKKLTNEKKSRTASKKEAKSKETKEKKKVDIAAMNEKMAAMIQASGVKDVSMKADDVSFGKNTDVIIDVNGKNKDMAGMQIIFDGDKYEVSEYQAGPKGEDMLIFGDHKTLGSAVKQALKGNYTDGGQKPQKVLDGSDGPGTDLYKPFDKYKKEQDAKKSGGKKDEKMPINPKDWKDEPGSSKPSKKKETPKDVITEGGANPQDYKGGKHQSDPGYKSQSKADQKNIDTLASTKTVDWNKTDPDLKAQFDEDMDYVRENLNDMSDKQINEALEGDDKDKAELAKEVVKLKKIKDPLDQAIAFSSSSMAGNYEYLEESKVALLATVAQIKKDTPEAFKTFNPKQTRLFKSIIIKALNRI